MKKKMVIFLLLLFSTILLSGCNKKRNNVKKKELNFVEWAEKNLVDFYPSSSKAATINCPEINKDSIMIGSNDNFTNGKNIYAYSEYELFSNDKNCKFIESFKGDKLITLVSSVNTVAIDEKGRLWDLDNTTNKINYLYSNLWADWINTFNDQNINNSIISAFNSQETESSLPAHNIVAYNNNELNLYNFSFHKGENKKYKVNIDNIENEKIEKIYGSIVKTNKAFYIIKPYATNKDKCEKYIDIKCIYENKLIKNKILTKYYDEVLNITNKSIITKNYKVIPLSDIYNM